jgi:hypothetical protein
MFCDWADSILMLEGSRLVNQVLSIFATGGTGYATNLTYHFYVGRCSVLIAPP